MHFIAALSLLWATAAALPGIPTIVTRQEDLKQSYDFLIVGGGTAGLTLADHLTENPAGILTSVYLSLCS